MAEIVMIMDIVTMTRSTKSTKVTTTMTMMTTTMTSTIQITKTIKADIANSRTLKCLNLQSIANNQGGYELLHLQTNRESDENEHRQ